MKRFIFSAVILAACVASITMLGEPAAAQSHAPALDLHAYQAMAFVLAGLRRVGHGGCLSTGSPAGIWHYMIPDDAATVEGANYFGGAAGVMAKGDLILASLEADQSTPKEKTYVVRSNDGTTVVIGAQIGSPVALASAQKSAIQRFQFAMNLADIVSGDLVTAYTPGFAGKILSINVFALKAATTGAKAATLTPKINSTNTTGGAAALTSANMTPQGTKVAGSAITAANVFTATDTIGIVASAVTAFVEGVALVVIDLENTDLVNALQA